MTAKATPCFGELLFLTGGVFVGRFKRVEKPLCLALSAILLCFYLYTLYQGLHPRMSRGYQTFYLGQELVYWPGEEGILVNRGETICFDARTQAPGQIAGHFYKSDFGYGEEYEWQYLDGRYCIVGWQSDLMFEVERGESYQVSIVFEPSTPAGEISIFANGENVACCVLDNTPKEVLFELPPWLTEDGRLILLFVAGGEVELPLAVREVTFW